METNISIIIPTHNRAKFIERTIMSFLNQVYDNGLFEIIIINNNSTDNTEEVVNKIIQLNSKISIRQILLEKLGLHFARNTGALIAKYDILYFADDDVVADRFLLKEIIKPFLINEKVGVVTGKVLPLWEKKPPIWILKHCQNHILSLLNPDFDLLIAPKIPFLYGCHQAILKNLFINSGGSNPDIIGPIMLGNGESGLNLKINKMGYKMAYTSSSITHHIMPESRMTQKYLNKRFSNSGREHAYSKFQEFSNQNQNFNYSFLLLQILKVFIIDFIFKTLKLVFKVFKYFDVSYFRFIIANLFYSYNKILYYKWLIMDINLREFVAKENWMEEDNKFNDIYIKYSK